MPKARAAALPPAASKTRRRSKEDSRLRDVLCSDIEDMPGTSVQSGSRYVATALTSRVNLGSSACRPAGPFMFSQGSECRSRDSKGACTVCGTTPLVSIAVRINSSASMLPSRRGPSSRPRSGCRCRSGHTGGFTPLSGPREPGDIPLPDLRGAVGDQLRFHLRRMGGLTSPLTALPGLPQDPVHRRGRTPVMARVHFPRPDLSGRQFGVLRTVQQLKHCGPFSSRQS